MKLILKQIYQNSRFYDSETIKLIFDSFSKNEDVRYYVAYNPNTPSFTLGFLSKDISDSVRFGVTWNPSTPSSALELLSKDENETVRRGVAQNPTYIKYKEENGL